jgi:hypothetical protein
MNLLESGLVRIKLKTMIDKIKILSEQARSGADTPAQITIDLFNIACDIEEDEEVYDLQYHIKVILAIMDKRLTTDIRLLTELDELLEKWQEKEEK